MAILKRLLLIAACLVSLAVAAEPATNGAPVLTFAQITDCHLRPQHNALERFKAALHHLRQHHPDIAFVLNTGDTIDGADGPTNTVAKWGFWKSAVDAELQGVPVYSVLGNHDMLESGPTNDALYGKAGACRMLGMPSRYYSFDRGGWHFVLLDGNGFGGDKAQMEWLKKELASTPTNTPIAIVSHHPIFSMGAVLHSPGDFIGNWKELVALFVAHPNVKLCLSGHVHLFDKAWYNGVTYVCGGSLAGYWWEMEKSSDGRSAYHETRPGYGIVRLYADGSSDYEYVRYAD